MPCIQYSARRLNYIVIDIIFAILCSTGVLILFRSITLLGANTSHTIFVSYAVSALAGLLILPVLLDKLVSLWLVVAAIEGAAFYGVFHLMARSVSASGVSFTGLASKMSVVIPIAIGLLFLGESSNTFVVLGVMLGISSMALSVSGSIDVSGWRWPVLVFIGNGVIDASFKLFQVWGLDEIQFAGFIVSIFVFAFLTGFVRYLILDRTRLVNGSLYAGITLGLLNLGTVHFLMQALAVSGLDSVLVYSLNSFGIVLMSLLVAVWLFRESISKRGYAGIALAVASIVSLYFSHI